jgi:hypothetical protein
MDVCPRLSVVCCPVYVEAFATGWSLVQRRLTECLNRLRNLPCEASKVLKRTAEQLMMTCIMTPWNKFNSTKSNRQLKSFVTILHSNVCSVDAKHRMWQMEKPCWQRSNSCREWVANFWTPLNMTPYQSLSEWLNTKSIFPYSITFHNPTKINIDISQTTVMKTFQMATNITCCCCCSCRWVKSVSLNCGHQQAYCSCPRWHMSMERHGGMIRTEEIRRNRRTACPSATLSTTNPTWTDPCANSGLCSERPATNCLNHASYFSGNTSDLNSGIILFECWQTNSFKIIFS